jgi:S1-C subfamily serine protease
MHEKQYHVHELLLFNLWVRRLNIKVFGGLSLSLSLRKLMGLKTYWKVTENQGYLDDLKGSQLKEFFDCMAPTVVNVENKKGGSGSGVIIDEGRHIITCARVLEGDLEPTIITASQKGGTKASISKYDRESDFCVLKYQKNEDVDYAEVYLGDDTVKNIGQEVYIISMSATLPHVFTAGKITGYGTYGTLGFDFGNKSQPMFMVSDISIVSGCSGAPVFDARGRVLGIVTHEHLGYPVVRKFVGNDVV